MIRGNTEPVFFQLPRNFLFFQRLPARFSMVVLKAGNETPKGRWYEVEIRGQQLNLLSRVPLKPGSSVLVEKHGDHELKLLQNNASNPVSGNNGLDVFSPASATANAETTFFPETFLDLASLLALREWESNNEQIIEPRQAAVYRFTLPGETPLSGAFTGESGKWRLYLPDILSRKEAAELSAWLNDLGVYEVHLLPEKELARLGAGLDILG